MNNIQTEEFIQRKFAEYYKRNSNSIQPPTLMGNREFAFLLFEEKMMLRHKSLKTADDLRGLLQKVAPSDVYYSSAYFENPEMNMDAKGWIGADLIFDIDADHIPTPCDKRHDKWKCLNCGTTGQGTKPEKCPRCNAQKFDQTSWPCEICLESAKTETIKLIDILDKDFGFSMNELNLAFSGHRGYHVHIENEAIRTLDSIARREIVDYMIGLGLAPEPRDFEKGNAPNLEDHGWRGRIAKGAYEFLLEASQEQLENAGLKKPAAVQIIQKRAKILESWRGTGPWKILRTIDPRIWEKIVQQAIKKQSANIDTVVTTDVHRLIRLANTLHGETGLRKINVRIDEIEGFDPFKSAIAFQQGTTKVDVSESPQFRLRDTIYGPYHNTKVELPTAAAMLLLCKGAARITEEESIVQ